MVRDQLTSYSADPVLVRRESVAAGLLGVSAKMAWIVSALAPVPAVVRLQAEAFRDRVRNLLQFYVELARREERATICAKVREAGQLELADAIRRI